jgi:hypothetical protein
MALTTRANSRRGNSTGREHSSLPLVDITAGNGAQTLHDRLHLRDVFAGQETRSTGEE